MNVHPSYPCRCLKSLAVFLAEQPSQLKYIEWPGFQNTVCIPDKWEKETSLLGHFISFLTDIVCTVSCTIETSLGMFPLYYLSLFCINEQGYQNSRLDICCLVSYLTF